MPRFLMEELLLKNLYQKMLFTKSTFAGIFFNHLNKKVNKSFTILNL